MPTVEEITNLLVGFKDLLTVEQEGNYIIVKAVTWLEKENFQKIMTLLKEYGAEWLKAGKMSHWRIPVGTVEANPKLAVEVNHIQKAQQLMTEALDELKKAGY